MKLYTGRTNDYTKVKLCQKLFLVKQTISCSQLGKVVVVEKWWQYTAFSLKLALLKKQTPFYAIFKPNLGHIMHTVYTTCLGHPPSQEDTHCDLKYDPHHLVILESLQVDIMSEIYNIITEAVHEGYPKLSIVPLQLQYLRYLSEGYFNLF